jgi:hypothetical protein
MAPYASKVGGRSSPCPYQVQGHSSWEYWRLAGEFRFSAPDWPGGRRRSQEVHAYLVVMTEEKRDCRLITIDSDFRIYRRFERQTIPLIAPVK